MICSQRINPPSVSFVGRSSCHGCSVKEKAGESGDSLPILTKVTIFLTSVDEKGKRESYSIGTRRGKLTLRSPLSNGHLVWLENLALSYISFHWGFRNDIILTTMWRHLYVSIHRCGSVHKWLAWPIHDLTWYLTETLVYQSKLGERNSEMGVPSA